jgi:hypothetical protein
MDVMEPSSRRHTADLTGASKHWGLCNGFVGRQFVVREDKSALPSRFPSQDKPIRL